MRKDSKMEKAEEAMEFFLALEQRREDTLEVLMFRDTDPVRKTKIMCPVPPFLQAEICQMIREHYATKERMVK